MLFLLIESPVQSRSFKHQYVWPAQLTQVNTQTKHVAHITAFLCGKPALNWSITHTHTYITMARMTPALQVSRRHSYGIFYSTKCGHFSHLWSSSSVHMTHLELLQSSSEWKPECILTPLLAENQKLMNHIPNIDLVTKRTLRHLGCKVMQNIPGVTAKAQRRFVWSACSCDRWLVSPAKTSLPVGCCLGVYAVSNVWKSLPAPTSDFPDKLLMALGRTFGSLEVERCLACKTVVVPRLLDLYSMYACTDASRISVF